jgi:hypothetical protein
MRNNSIDLDDLFTINQILKGSDFEAISRISNGSYGEIYRIANSEGEYAIKVISK